MEYLLGVVSLLWLILKVAIGIGFVIFVHELGHFLVAKMCGVKVEKFLVGFDVPLKIGPFNLPRTLWKKQWGETFYAIGVIPLGGYVKMLGQDDNPANYEAEAERTKVRKPHHEDVIDAGMVAVGVNEDDRGDHVEPLEAVGNHEGDRHEPAELDPRSYTAKSVPQRMAIISAGVIMNVIFAFIMAAVAYGLGVSEMPAVIAGTGPGSPAWTGSENWGEIAHLQPGDKIVQVGRDGQPYEHLRFKEDVMVPIFLNGTEEELEMLVERDGKRSWVSLRPRPSDPTSPRSPPVIGVELPRSVTLAKESPVLEHMPAGKATPPFQGADKIVEVAGEPVEGWPDVQRILARRMGETLTFTVERTSEESASGGEGTTRVEIPVGPHRMRDLGLHMKPGPLAAVQVGSPAHAAGLEAGDVIVSIDGEPLGDPMTLGQRLQERIGESVPVVARRGEQEREFTVTPRAPDQIAGPSGTDSPLGIEEIGIAFHVLSEVAAVQSGGPAEDKLQPGDRIVQAELRPADDEQKAKLEKLFTEEALKPIPLSESKRNWPQVHGLLQQVLPGTKLELTFVRNGATKTAVLTPVESEEYFNPQRGVVLTRLTDTHQASSFGEAVSLGLRETKERFMDVLLVLGKLATGQLSITNLSGPAGIAYVAGAEASQGVGNLLIFLVFLSVNLAIVNALPIPVLDGGHFVFLLWEGIFGKPVSEKWVIRLTFAGLIFLLGLMVFVTTMDIGRFTGMMQ